MDKRADNNPSKQTVRANKAGQSKIRPSKCATGKTRKKTKPINRPTIEQVADSLAVWFEIHGPELMRRRQEKLNAAQQNNPSAVNTREDED